MLTCTPHPLGKARSTCESDMRLFNDCSHHICLTKGMDFADFPVAARLADGSAVVIRERDIEWARTAAGTNKPLT